MSKIKLLSKNIKVPNNRYALKKPEVKISEQFKLRSVQKADAGNESPGQSVPQLSDLSGELDKVHSSAKMSTLKTNKLDREWLSSKNLPTPKTKLQVRGSNSGGSLMKEEKQVPRLSVETSP